MPKTPELNRELLLAVRKQVKADQRRKVKKVDMNSWVHTNVDKIIAQHKGTWKKGNNLVLTLADLPCGTTACIAGWASLLHGDKVVITDYDSGFLDEVIPKDLKRAQRDISDRAQQLLGLTDDEASFLFNLGNDFALWGLELILNSPKRLTEAELNEARNEEISAHVWGRNNIVKETQNV